MCGRLLVVIHILFKARTIMNLQVRQKQVENTVYQDEPTVLPRLLNAKDPVLPGTNATRCTRRFCFLLEFGYLCYQQ